MKLRRQKGAPHNHEDAARYGVKANTGLGAVQLVVGLATGNYGFIAEAGHQAADAASLQAKANAMNENTHPIRARRLRKAAAGVLLLGGSLGIFGGLKHIHDNTNEDSSWIELTAAVAGAAVNTAIARKTHGAESGHDHDGHAHSHGVGAEIDTIVHVMTDMGTGWAYAAGLYAERYIPGVTNYILIANGTVVGGAGVHTLGRIARDENGAHEHTDTDHEEAA